jgi:hypothetical protein
LKGLKADYYDQYTQHILTKFNMLNLRPAKTPLDPGVKLSKSMSPQTPEATKEASLFPYRSVIGSLMYLMLCTRPDIAFAISQLSKYNSCYGPDHINAVKHLIRYISYTHKLQITYGNCTTAPIGFSDSSYSSDVDTRRSVTGYVFFVAGGPVSWKSQNQDTVALSSAEAEYMALCAATQEAIHLRFLMQDMDPKYRQSNSAVLIFEDNTACIAMSANPVHHERTKHIDNKYHFIRERIYMRDIQVQFVGTNVMIADLLTKAVTPQVSLTLLPALMGMTNIFDHVAEYYPTIKCSSKNFIFSLIIWIEVLKSI